MHLSELPFIVEQSILLDVIHVYFARTKLSFSHKIVVFNKIDSKWDLITLEPISLSSTFLW